MPQDKLEGLLKQPFDCPVYYFASTEEALLREAAAKVKVALRAAGGDEDVTRIDGPSPDLDGVVAAAGAISFFGTPRVVELYEIMPTSIKDKDAEELAGLFGQLENSVLVVTCLYKDKKAATGKKAKLLFAAAQKAGHAAELAKPGRRENLDFIARCAAEQGAALAPGTAEALLERAGDNRPLLENEVAKLAAVSGYGTITTQMVQRHATHNIEADVFELARMITGGRKAAAYAKLADLLALRHEPIAIAAALSGSFVDMYRVRVGTEARRTTSAIFKELGYTGSDWRLKKAQESAARYSTRQLGNCVLYLAQLDRELKSSALPDKTVLLQAAMARLMETGKQ